MYYTCSISGNKSLRRSSSIGLIFSNTSKIHVKYSCFSSIPSLDEQRKITLIMLKQNQLKFKKKTTLLSLCVSVILLLLSLLQSSLIDESSNFEENNWCYSAQLVWSLFFFLFFLVVSAYLPHSKLIKISSYKKENLEAFRFPGHVKRLARFQCTKNLWYTACYSPKEPETTKRPN